MSSKCLNCFLFILFWNWPQLVVSRPISIKENEFDRQISDDSGVRSNSPTSLDSAMMAKSLQPSAETPTPPEDAEGTNSLAMDLDFNLFLNKSICVDNFYIMPRTDGLPGSRTIAEMLDFGGDWVPIKCIWSIAEAWNSPVEISIEINQSDWGLSCTNWNLALEYALDQQISWTRTTVICPSERNRILKIPAEAKRAVLILTGLMPRSPRFSLEWTYTDMPKISDVDRDKKKPTGSPLTVITSFSVAFIISFSCVCLYGKWKRRRTGPTDEGQYQTEQDAFPRPFSPPRPRMWAFARGRARARQILEDELPLLPGLEETSFSTTFQLQPPPAEHLMFPDP